MADIDIQRTHALGLERARAVAERIAAELEADYGMVCRRDGDVLHFARAGAEGQLRVRDSDIHLQVRLGFLLSAFRTRIAETLEGNFARYFGDSA